MKSILVIILLLAGFSSKGQESTSSFVVVTIEWERNSNLHKSETDYWIVSRKLWEKSSKEAVLPLYLTGFSLTDFKECCTDNSLILFNTAVGENFNFGADFVNSQNILIQLIATKRKKVQTIRKKWVTGHKEKAVVYLTPISGRFCLCPIVHRDGSSKLGYDGQAAIPVSDFSHDSIFWSSSEARQIERFDYADLPFLGLHNIQ
ncbi:MAG TPA: hypothetical protein VK658_29180 [Chryseolinea sp.]|nr:hypothetical protein [Chryseolinea sp.]